MQTPMFLMQQYADRACKCDSGIFTIDALVKYASLPQLQLRNAGTAVPFLTILLLSMV